MDIFSAFDRTLGALQNLSSVPDALWGEWHNLIADGQSISDTLTTGAAQNWLNAVSNFQRKLRTNMTNDAVGMGTQFYGGDAATDADWPLASAQHAFDLGPGDLPLHQYPNLNLRLPQISLPHPDFSDVEAFLKSAGWWILIGAGVIFLGPPIVRAVSGKRR